MNLKKTKYIYLILLTVFVTNWCNAQRNDSLYNKIPSYKKQQFDEATFKSTRIINGQSINNPLKNEFVFTYSQRYGIISSGIHTFFGLDQTENMRLGIEYGITDRLAVGLAHCKQNQIFEGSMKYKILKQKTGKTKFPFSLSIYSAVNLTNQEVFYSDGNDLFTRKLTYCFELLLAHKFNKIFSAQLIGGILHRNIVRFEEEPNTTGFIGCALSARITKDFSFCAEYYNWVSNITLKDYKNPFSFGFEFEKGDFIFQFHVSNTEGIHETAFISESQNEFNLSNLILGLNVSYFFTLTKNKTSKVYRNKY